MSLQLVHWWCGGGDGHYNFEQQLSRMCKIVYPMGMLMEMVSHWLFVTVTEYTV
jgi:hypothetical protein